jgi:predicted acyltransferase
MKKERLLSLDAFRGITIAGMILVNNPGSWEFVFAPLRHSKWNGCTPTDLVFPFFLFIVGVAMWFSFKAFNHNINTTAVKKILKRTIVIFFIGVFLNIFPFTDFNFSSFRIMGVLQRIALAYFVASFLCLSLQTKKLAYASIVLLVIYWLIFVLSGYPNPYELSNNISRSIDIRILGSTHLYQGFGLPFDPEGLLGTISATVTVLIGYLTGRLIDTAKTRENSVLQMLLWGISFIFAAMVFDYLMPINKPLWTSSYVLYTGGLALVCLAFCVWFIDVKEIKAWSKPFIIFGSNPLFIYAFSGVFGTTLYYIKIGDSSLYGWLYNNVFAAYTGPYLGSLLFAISIVLTCWLVAWGLYKKKIFIKI